jgi:hypothetical protein
MTSDEDQREPEDATAQGRFLDLARRLVRVPKEEIDAERAKEDQRKEDEREGRHFLPSARRR